MTHSPVWNGVLVLSPARVSSQQSKRNSLEVAYIPWSQRLDGLQQDALG